MVVVLDVSMHASDCHTQFDIARHSGCSACAAHFTTVVVVVVVSVGGAAVEPLVVEHVDPSHLQPDVVVHEGVDGRIYAYLGTSDVYVFDVTDPRAATAVGVVPVGALVVGLGLTDSHLIVGTEDPHELQVFGLGVPGVPGFQGSLDIYSAGVCSDGTWVYVAGGNLGLRIIDISDPSDPQVAHAVATPGSVASISVGNGMAIVGDDAAVLDVVDLHAP